MMKIWLMIWDKIKNILSNRCKWTYSIYQLTCTTTSDAISKRIVASKNISLYQLKCSITLYFALILGIYISFFLRSVSLDSNFSMSSSVHYANKNIPNFCLVEFPAILPSDLPLELSLALFRWKTPLFCTPKPSPWVLQVKLLFCLAKHFHSEKEYLPWQNNGGNFA